MNVYFYDLNENFIVIKKGVFTPKEINVPYERVQDIYVDQDIFDRLFGLYDVHISSATISSGMAAHIDGVEKIAADGLKDFLLKTVQTKIGRELNKTSPTATT
jgi:putative membrane protein